ncbi:MAG: Protein involved in biosynthesis of mitomycin antibiotics/polyketide fumonisin [Phenylobacterium sp.]|nr:Protein involved in biosynthesis of mitomycin antibiotics/polyketide fumonisin [Phenylobacterium sp.]
MKITTQEDWFRTVTWIDKVEGDVAQAAQALGKTLTPEEAGWLERWRADGYLVLENAAEEGDIDAFLEDVRWAVEHREELDFNVEVRGQQVPFAGVPEADLFGAGMKLQQFHTYSKAAVGLSLSSRIQRFLALVFEQPAVVLQSLAFWRGSEQPAHIDYPYVRIQTRIGQLAAAWIALEDARPGCGPLFYYPGSHRPAASGFFDWGGGSILLEPDSIRTAWDFAQHLQCRMADVGIEPIEFYPRKGAAIVWHPNLVHGGSPISDPAMTRKSYVTHYTSASAFPRQYAPATLARGVNAFDARPGFAFDSPWDARRRKFPSWSSQVYLQRFAH